MDYDASILRKNFSDVWPFLDERSRRIMAANEARSLGYGGVTKIRHACGLSRKAISKGIREISEGNYTPGRIRRQGAGRKRTTFNNPNILPDLEYFLDRQR